MKKLFFLILIAVLSINPVGATNIVYPKTTKTTITAPSTFFIGNENPKTILKINNEVVNIHKSGGFIHPVNLEYGVNEFIIKNQYESKIYRITRPKTETTTKEYKPINYNTPIYVETIADLSPLRSSPYSQGLNRLQSLQKGIPLTVVGEFAEFYKVQLARDDFAWIAKSRVKKSFLQYNSPAKILSTSFSENEKERVFTFELDKKVPFTFDPMSIYATNENLEFFKEYVKNYQLTIFNIANVPEGKYEFIIDKTAAPFGYKVYYDNNTLTVKIKNPPAIDKKVPLKGIKIMLDPGHGGYESGAIGCLGNKEKDTNLEIAYKLKSHLQKAGAIVIMSRIGDTPLGLTERVLASQENNVDIFISIHNNALPDSAAWSNRSGSGTYYYNLHSHELAENIQERLVNELKMDNDKVRRESFAVIRNPQTIAVLVEIGYVIKPEDNAKLVNPKFQDKAAVAIMHGLENYLNDLQK
jgi:N-acetylmuramoyl-L-alanine amidase